MRLVRWARDALCCLCRRNEGSRDPIARPHTRRWQSSDTRKPVEYINSIIALSRTPGRRARIRLTQQAVHFLHAQKVRQTLPKFRRLNIFRGIGRDKTLHHREPKEMANGDEVSCHRAAVEVLAVQRAQKIDNVAPAHVIRAQFALCPQRQQIFGCRADRPAACYRTSPFRRADSS